MVNVNKATHIQAYNSLQSIHAIFFFAPTQNLTANTSEDKIRKYICIFEDKKCKRLTVLPPEWQIGKDVSCVYVCVEHYWANRVNSIDDGIIEEC
jgi:hypothetical protein